MKKLNEALTSGGDLSEKIMNITSTTKTVYICESKSWRKLPTVEENFPNILKCQPNVLCK